jgi:hypothetical protein
VLFLLLKPEMAQENVIFINRRVFCHELILGFLSQQLCNTPAHTNHPDDSENDPDSVRSQPRPQELKDKINENHQGVLKRVSEVFHKTKLVIFFIPHFYFF